MFANRFLSGLKSSNVLALLTVIGLLATVSFLWFSETYAVKPPKPPAPDTVGDLEIAAAVNHWDSRKCKPNSNFLLMSADGMANLHQSEILRVDRQRIRRWRGRWAGAYEALVAAENEEATDRDLEQLIVTALSDEERSGAPPTFSPEQVAAIIALACEPPEDSGLPVSLRLLLPLRL